MSSLIPNRQFVFSPCLAATIGLEEAILLQCLSDESQISEGQTQPGLNPEGLDQSGYQWHELTQKWLGNHLPFWTAQNIGRIAENLRQQGIILIASPPLPECGHIRFAFNEKAAVTQAPQQINQTAQAEPDTPSPQARHDTNQALAYARPISSSWTPDETCMKLLAQQGVPANFARDCTAEFVQYWSERGEARHSWGNRFVTHTLRRWRDFETRQSQEQREQRNGQAAIPSWATSTTQARQAHPIDRSWKPSTDAMEILEIQAGIHRHFVEDAIPEFVLYWQEKGEHSNTWNARFINHVKRQWAGFRHATKNDLEPRPIDPNWQPSPDVYDVLRFARIDLEFAKNLVPEFIIYWRDRNEVRPSWNTIFLQFAKTQWARESQLEQQNENKSIKETSFRDRLTDRSWA